MTRTSVASLQTDYTVSERASPAPEWAADRGEDRGGRLLGGVVRAQSRCPIRGRGNHRERRSRCRAGVYLRGVEVFTVR
jgi:hypothetical protein